MERGLLLNVVVRERAAVLKLLAREDQTLPLRTEDSLQKIKVMRCQNVGCSIKNSTKSIKTIGFYNETTYVLHGSSKIEKN